MKLTATAWSLVIFICFKLTAINMMDIAFMFVCLFVCMHACIKYQIECTNLQMTTQICTNTHRICIEHVDKFTSCTCIQPHLLCWYENVVDFCVRPPPSPLNTTTVVYVLLIYVSFSIVLLSENSTQTNTRAHNATMNLRDHLFDMAVY